MRLCKLFYLLIVTSLPPLFSSTSHAAELLDSVVAEVNDSIITESELQKRIADIQKTIAARKGRIPPVQQLRPRVLERMIFDELQLQRARLFGLKMNDIQLNARLEQLARLNKMTLSQLRSKLLEEGMSYKDFREKVRRDTIIQRLQKGRVFDRIHVSDNEIEQFLSNQKKSSKDLSYRLSHILINIPEAANSAQIAVARGKAEKILARLKAGENFEEVAIETSAAHEALEGGDLGWRTAAELPSLFVKAVEGLKKGDITGILQSPTGFHILKLTDTGSSKKVLVNETRARHILIKTDELTSDADARRQLVELRKELVNGVDFAELAKEYSQDPGTKGVGGDLGWAVPGKYVKRFEEVMNSLEVNQISEPFKSTFGWHLMQVTGRRQSDKTELVERNQAYQAIQRSRADEALQLWLRSLMDEAYIKYHNPADKPAI